MSWGSAFSNAWNKATDKAKHIVSEVAVGLRWVGNQGLKTWGWSKEQAGKAVDWGKQQVIKVVNVGFGLLGKAGEAQQKANEKIKSVFEKAKSVFGKASPAAPVVACKLPPKSDDVLTATFDTSGDLIIANSITIRGSAEFQRMALAAYTRLYTTASGKKMIKGIEDSGKKVTVLDGRDPAVSSNYPANTCTGANGAGSTISWDPDQHNLSGFTTADGKPLPTGSDIILGHESVHAYHNALGTNANGPLDSYPPQNGSSSRGEERATVGVAGTSIVDPSGNTVTVSDYSATSPTENSLRRELCLPERTTYYPTNWKGGPPW